MKKFEFRLKTLLRLRDALRDQRRVQLAEAYRADEMLQEQQLRLEKELQDLDHQRRKASAPGEIDVDSLLAEQRYGLVVDAQRKRVLQQRQDVAAEIQRRRQRLIEADREVRVLEKLRERQQERHRAEENRQEIKMLDEVAERRGAREDVS